MRDYELAWWLADVVAHLLPATEQAAIYVELGSGQYWESITRILSAAVHQDLTVPGPLLAEVSRWLDGYLGNVDEPAARILFTLLVRRSQEHEHAALSARAHRGYAVHRQGLR